MMMSTEISLNQTVTTYPTKAGHLLWQPKGTLWDRPSPSVGPPLFLDPSAARYVVVSVDPAGGGTLSDEVFIVFLVADDQFGLLSGRAVPSHNQKYGYSMVPLVFVLSLLYTLKSVRELLRTAHRKAKMVDQAFRMPPVIVLIENNFAYGAAVYMQMLYFIRQRQHHHSDLRNFDIIFATPGFLDAYI